MFERYTKRARDTIVLARQEARQHRSPEIRPEHILLALLNDDAIRRMLRGSSVEEIRQELSVSVSSTEKEAITGDFPPSSDSLKVLYMATEEADRLNEEQVGNEHLLMGLLRVETSNAAQVLIRKGITISDIRSKIAALRTRITIAAKPKRSWRSLLDRSSAAQSDEEAVLLRGISKLVGRGKSRTALKLIDKFMVDAPAADSSNRIRKFAPHAAAIARAIGDVSMAKKYYELALDYSRDNPLSLYGMADVLDLHGEHEKAREYAIQCYQLAAASKGPLNEGILELIKRRFPI